MRYLKAALHMQHVQAFGLWTLALLEISALWWISATGELSGGVYNVGILAVGSGFIFTAGIVTCLILLGLAVCHMPTRTPREDWEAFRSELRAMRAVPFRVWQPGRGTHTLRAVSELDAVARYTGRDVEAVAPLSGCAGIYTPQDGTPPVYVEAVR